MVDAASSIMAELDVSRETRTALQEFSAMVSQWTSRINLISPGTASQIWERHILDSAQLFALAKDGAVWVDIGTGGGFPGVVLAIMAREGRPETEFHFIESDRRKAVFLRKAVQVFGLNVVVHDERSERVPPLRAQVVSARALAPLNSLLEHVLRHMDQGGRAILPKGARATDEIAEARRNWNFDLAIHPSVTDSNAQILVIENLSHV